MNSLEPLLPGFRVICKGGFVMTDQTRKPLFTVMFLLGLFRYFLAFLFLLFGFQGHHFKIVGLPNPPYMVMNPNGYTADGSTTYKITGYLPEVLDNLKVSYARK